MRKRDKRTKPVRFETWKGSRVITYRKNGKIVSRVKQKGTGIKSVEEAKSRIKRFGTFKKNTLALQKSKIMKKRDVKNLKEIQVKVSDKKVKKIDVKNKNVKTATLIGKTTVLISSEKKLKKQGFYQNVCRIQWGSPSNETIGYSDIRGSKRQAFKRALGGAINLGYITYEAEISKVNKNELIAVEPNGKKIKIKMDCYIQTYVKK